MNAKTCMDCAHREILSGRCKEVRERGTPDQQKQGIWVVYFRVAPSRPVCERFLEAEIPCPEHIALAYNAAKEDQPCQPSVSEARNGGLSADR